MILDVQLVDRIQRIEHLQQTLEYRIQEAEHRVMEVEKLALHTNSEFLRLKGWSRLDTVEKLVVAFGEQTSRLEKQLQELGEATQQTFALADEHANRKCIRCGQGERLEAHEQSWWHAECWKSELDTIPY